MNPWHLHQAIRCIRAGGVIAYPTEAVWGLGCDPTNEESVQRILELKSRPENKGLVLVGSSLQQFEHLICPLSADDLAKVNASSGITIVANNSFERSLNSDAGNCPSTAHEALTKP